MVAPVIFDDANVLPSESLISADTTPPSLTPPIITDDKSLEGVKEVENG